jgi:hypothetical protein
LNKTILFFFIGLSLFSLTSCTEEITPPPSSFVDRTMTDYSFLDVSNNCDIYTNVNVTNLTSPCVENKSILSVFFSDEYNWSIMCCEFNDKCNNQYINTTEYDLICNPSDNSSYTGYLYNDQGFWIAQCCDTNGQNCYVDLDVDINNSITICDETYHQNIYGMNYNGSIWNAMCCIGGLDE